MDQRKLLYTKTHEWVRVDGETAIIGISPFAAEQLTDITYIELPHPGDHIFNGQECGNIETVKAVSDLYAPLDGEVTSVNEALVNDPAGLTEDPLGKGWLIKVRLEPGVKTDHLLNYEQYKKQIESETH
jgi:glycine cleavage system H protein